MNPFILNPAVYSGSLAKDAKPMTKAEAFEEIAWSETDVLQSYMPFASNPDPIVRSKSLKIYREMLSDDQIQVCVNIRIQARLSSQWTIKAGKDGDAKAIKMADFAMFCLKRMRGNFESDLEQIYSAIPYGFSVSEKIYEYMDSGPFKGMIALKAIKTREPFNYDFKIDGYGNLEGLIYTGVGLNPSQSKGISDIEKSNPLSRVPWNTGGYGSVSNPFPPEKFIIYSYNQRFGNWYGWSDLNAAYPWWVKKKHGAKFWAIWLERYASPVVWAQVKRDASMKKAALDRIDDFLRNLSARNGIRVSDAVTLNALETTATRPTRSPSKLTTATFRMLFCFLIFSDSQEVLEVAGQAAVEAGVTR